MIVKDLKQIIGDGESLTVEFKECKEAVNKDVYKTIGAFLNRNGGHIILGVKDNGTITGINKEHLSQIKKDLITSLNNPQKINPPLYILPEEFNISGKTVIYLPIPESSQVHRVNGRIFDRNEDGDLDITLQSHSVAELFIRKQTSYSENRIYPYVEISDLRKDLISRVREMISSRQPSHPWVNLNDIELLKSARLFQKDYRTKEEGFTLAAIMLLGKDEVIQSILPHHKTDAILRIENTDRYDDRDDIRTNLIDSYDRLSAFIVKHLPDPFYLEGDIRISLRDTIFREVISNMLIHREFLNGFPAKLIIEKDNVITENWNRPHGHGLINPLNFSPFPKNPIIARFFKEIGRADELGSGVRNLYKYSKIYTGKEPHLFEADVFRTIIPIRNLENTRKNEGAFEGVPEGAFEGALEGAFEKIITEQIYRITNKTKDKLIILLKSIIKNEGKRIPFYSESLPQIPAKSIERYVKFLKDANIIVFKGNASHKGGFYLTEQAKTQIKSLGKRNTIPNTKNKIEGAYEEAYEGAYENIITERISKITNKTKDKLIILLKSIIKNEGERMPFYSGSIPQIHRKSIERYIKFLKDAGIIEFRGEAFQKGGYYLTEEIRNRLNTNQNK